MDMEEIADKTGLDFIINVLLTPNRDIGRIFCGHWVIAYKDAMQSAPEYYSAPPISDADIILANVYPFDTSLQFLNKGLWPFDRAPQHCSKVVMAACPEGLGYHALSLATVPGWPGFFQRMRAFSRHDVRRYLEQWTSREPGMLVFSANIMKRELKKLYPQAEVFSLWENLISELKSRHSGSAVKVAVYPCSPLQVPRDAA
jgi:hypothetical protein